MEYEEEKNEEDSNELSYWVDWASLEEDDESKTSKRINKLFS